MSPEYFPSPEDEKKRYASHNNDISNTGYLSYLNNFLSSVFYPFVPKHSSILDFGSGPVPVLADILKIRGFTVDYYDPFFAPSLEWKEKKYDAVTAVEVFEHLHNPSEAIKNLSSVLKNNGYLIIRTMLHPENKNFFSGWWYRQDCTHVSFFSERTFRLISDRYDFKLIAVKNNREIVLKKRTSVI